METATEMKADISFPAQASLKAAGTRPTCPPPPPPRPTAAQREFGGRFSFPG